MRHQARRRMQCQESGFTLIELLVVIVIVGLLAAIAIPAFLGQREKAEDAEAKAAVRTAMSAAKDYFVGHDDTYAGMDATGLRTVELSLNPGPGRDAHGRRQRHHRLHAHRDVQDPERVHDHRGRPRGVAHMRHAGQRRLPHKRALVSARAVQARTGFVKLARQRPRRYS